MFEILKPIIASRSLVHASFPENRDHALENVVIKLDRSCRAQSHATLKTRDATMFTGSLRHVFAEGGSIFSSATDS